MPFVPVANTALFEFRYLLDLQHIENTLYFESAGAITPGDLTALINAMETFWIAEFKPLIPVNVELVEMVATDLTTSTSSQVTQPPVSTQVGGVNDPSLPNNVTISVSFRTALRGRSFRGRNYWPALWETGVVKNTLQDTIVTAIQDAYTALISDAGVSGAGFTWVVVSRFSGIDGNGDPIPRVAGITTPVISCTIVDPTIDSARRRLPGRGR